jgi:hypothetical protein
MGHKTLNFNMVYIYIYKNIISMDVNIVIYSTLKFTVNEVWHLDSSSTLEPLTIYVQSYWFLHIINIKPGTYL